MCDLIRRCDVLDNINKRIYYFDKTSFDEAVKAVYNAPSVDATPRWISVEDEPPKNVYLQVYVAKFGYVEKAKYEGLLWRTSGGESLNIDWVTHWMPLPEPPAKGE